MNSLFDYQTKTMCHRNDPETSRQAAQKIVESNVLQNQEYSVMVGIIVYFKNKDFTAKELANKDIIDYHTIQRRLSGLHRKGYIERTGEKRNGCAVWRMK